MTTFELIKAMSIDDMAKFLAAVTYKIDLDIVQEYTVKFIPHWGMERARIMKVIFDNNSFVGISIETYNRREYVIKSENGVETYYVERVGSFLSEHFDFANQIFTSEFF